MLIKFHKSLPKIDKETGQRALDKNNKPRTLFIYTVHGTPEELDRYLAIMCEKSGKDSDSFKGDNGEVLYFTEYAIPFETGKLSITTNDNIVVDNSSVSIAESLMAQHPGPVGVLLAKQWLASNKTVDVNLSDED